MYFKIKSEAQEALKKAVDQFDCDFDDLTVILMMKSNWSFPLILN